MKWLSLLLFPWLWFKAGSYAKTASEKNIPGIRYFYFGRKTGSRLLGRHREFLQLLLSPVSIVRYFEFDYSERNLPDSLQGKKILDVSSPYLFSFYVADKFPELSYYYINPDVRDGNNIRSMLPLTGYDKVITVNAEDATQLQHSDASFDHIVSISVIEHISNNGDLKAIPELYRVLKPGGRMILTFPAKRKFEEEFRDHDVYELTGEKKQEKYFFQRFYDESSIQERILKGLGPHRIISKEIFGEKENGFFSAYEARWIKNKHFETVKDPFLISEYFTTFNSVSDLPGVGVVGLTIEKL